MSARYRPVVGDKVRIKATGEEGRVSEIDGWYIYVTQDNPTYIVYERYPHELELIEEPA